VLTFSPQTAVCIAVEHVDFRLGIDGLAQRCRALLAQDPMAGAVFVFRNRKSNAIKILTYDGQGFWLCHKRWSSGRLAWWPKRASHSLPVPARELQVLVYNGNPKGAKMAGDWRRVT
jgi:transposase